MVSIQGGLGTLSLLVCRRPHKWQCTSLIRPLDNVITPATCQLRDYWGAGHVTNLSTIGLHFALFAG